MVLARQTDHPREARRGNPPSVLSRSQKALVALTTAEARRIWLKAQRLNVEAPFGSGPAAVREAIEHLGYVQIDTINVIERCHHHILFTRLPDYQRKHLDQAQSVDKCVFEYWTHALSYVPTRDYRFFMRRMRHDWRRRSSFFDAVSRADVNKLVKRIRDDGPLTIRDLDHDVQIEKTHLWASRKPSKHILQAAFYQGLLTISRRDGMLKTYELSDRHFGWDRPPSAASDAETSAYLLDRALRAQGIVSLDSICHLDAARKLAVQRAIAARVRRGELIAATLGEDGREHWTSPAAIEEVHEPPRPIVHILSPFDPLVIQRKRLENFFGYAHRFEAYVPAPRRVLGYFALPILIGDEIVAAIDLKTDRSARKLLVQKWTWIGRGTARAHKSAIETALHRFERFQLDI